VVHKLPGVVTVLDVEGDRVVDHRGVSDPDNLEIVLHFTGTWWELLGALLPVLATLWIPPGRRAGGGLRRRRPRRPGARRAGPPGRGRLLRPYLAALAADGTVARGTGVSPDKGGGSRQRRHPGLVSNLEVTDRGAVRTLALNRPERRNALNEELLDRLPAELERAAVDPAVRAVVLTGRGGAFCAGGDLELMAGGVGDLEQGVARERAAALLREMPKPTMAAVNGPAAGGRVQPGPGPPTSAWRPPRPLHPRVWGGRPLRRLRRELPPSPPRRPGAGAAAPPPGRDVGRRDRPAPGLVGAVADADRFEDEVNALADRLAALAPLAVARVKANLSWAEGADFAAVLREEAEGMIALATTDDFKEAWPPSGNGVPLSSVEPEGSVQLTGRTFIQWGTV